MCVCLQEDKYISMREEMHEKTFEGEHEWRLKEDKYRHTGEH